MSENAGASLRKVVFGLGVCMVSALAIKVGIQPRR